MTALAGQWDFTGRTDAARECSRILRAQDNLGSNAAIWDSGRLALGSALSAFLPEDRFDFGPLVVDDGAFALIADVRIDNRAELGRALGIGPPRLREMSDAMLLLDSLLAWGISAVERLVGDFAFAFWERDRGTLTLARDFIGQRPLHYATASGFFAFASMPRGLHALDRIARRPSSDAAIRFMERHADASGDSFFDGISQVAPGHIVTVRAGQAHAQRWWTFDRDSDASLAGDSIEQARALLDDAVSRRLRGGSRLIGAHLSGGLDSSAVSATAARLLRDRGGKLICFTAAPRKGVLEVPRGAIADECDLARAVARQFDNVEHYCGFSDGLLEGVFERNLSLWERPVPNTFNDIWWSGISAAAAARGARILLTAPMGNIGLSHSGAELIAERMAARQFVSLSRLFADCRRQGELTWGQLARLIVGQSLPPTATRLMQRVRGQGGRNVFLTPHARVLSRTIAEAKPRKMTTLERRLDVIASVNAANFNSGAIAGWGVDMRDALADRSLIEFTLKLPVEAFFNQGRPRALARSVVADRVPRAVSEEQRRGLQGADYYLTLFREREQLIAEAEAISASSAAALVDGHAIRRALVEMPASGWGSHSAHHVYGANLIRALSAGHFLRHASAGQLA